MKIWFNVLAVVCVILGCVVELLGGSCLYVMISGVVYAYALLTIAEAIGKKK
jgi:hypothetical protein